MENYHVEIHENLNGGWEIRLHPEDTRPSMQPVIIIPIRSLGNGVRLASDVAHALAGVMISQEQISLMLEKRAKRKP